jgi:hypothetical protein
MRLPTVSSCSVDSSSSRINLLRSFARSFSSCSVLGQDVALSLSNCFIVQFSPQTQHRHPHGHCRCLCAIIRRELDPLDHAKELGIRWPGVTVEIRPSHVGPSDSSTTSSFVLMRGPHNADIWFFLLRLGLTAGNTESVMSQERRSGSLICSLVCGIRHAFSSQTHSWLKRMLERTSFELSIVTGGEKANTPLLVTSCLYAGEGNRR